MMREATECKVTVLLTVYNGMPYLPLSVESILAQSYKEFTFFIVNNGSTDGTKEYLCSLKDRRLHVVHLEENIGRTPVLEYALGQVATPLVAVIDADDLAAKDRLYEQVRLFESHPEVSLVGSDVAYINENGDVIGHDHFAVSHDELRDRLPMCNQFAHAACMFTTKEAQKAGGYPKKYPYAQDLGLWIRMIRNGCRVASIPKELAFIRIHTGQATRRPDLERARSLDNLRLTQEMLRMPNLSKAGTQTAFLRIAGAYALLGDTKQAIGACWKAIQVAPFLFFFNPLLWERLRAIFLKHLGRASFFS